MTTADGAVLGTTQIFGTAPRNRAFNVVLLADGFTAAQQTDVQHRLHRVRHRVLRHAARSTS